MKSLSKLYEEIDKLKLHSLVYDVKYKVSASSISPHIYFQNIVLSFPTSLDTYKIIQVRDYIKDSYCHNGFPVHSVELTASHTLELFVVKEGLSYENY